MPLVSCVWCSGRLPYVLVDHHGGSLGPDDGARDYMLEMEGSFRDPMSRQVDEDVRMRMCGWGQDSMQRQGRTETAQKCVLMNGKGEYFKPKSVRTIFQQL